VADEDSARAGEAPHAAPGVPAAEQASTFPNIRKVPATEPFRWLAKG